MKVINKFQQCLVFILAISLLMPSFALLLLCSVVPSAVPQNVRAHSTSSTSVLVTWDEVPKDKQHSDILHYTVIYKESEGGAEVKKQVDSPTSKLELTQLKAFTEYSIQVLAATIKGDGLRSVPITVSTDQGSK